MSAVPLPTPSRRATALGLLFTALGAALAAGYLVPYKVATARVGPEGLVLPMLLAAALLSSLLDTAATLWSRQGQGVGAQGRLTPLRRSRATLLVALLLGLASALGNEAVSQALRWLGPGLVSVTLRTEVLLVAFGGLLLLREPVGVRFWTGVALALGGYAALQLALRGAGAAVAWQGLAWAFVGAGSFASMQLAVRAAVYRIDALRVNTLRLWLAAGILALVPGRLGALPAVPWAVWGLAALAALSGPVLSRLCLMRALRYLPAAHATLAMLLGPLFAYLAAGVVLGTWPTGLEALAAGMILVGIALPVSALPGLRSARPRPRRAA